MRDEWITLGVISRGKALTELLMPRMEAMFVRLTLQVWLFVTTMGLNYQYPKDDMVEDSRRLLAAIRARDVNAAVAAWRTKVDNAAHYMLDQLIGPTRQ